LRLLRLGQFALGLLHVGSGLVFFQAREIGFLLGLALRRLIDLAFFHRGLRRRLQSATAQRKNQHETSHMNLA
jgi:hypothetical protein